MKLLNLSAGYGAYREGNVKTAAALGESCKLESSDRSSILLTSTKEKTARNRGFLVFSLVDGVSVF